MSAIKLTDIKVDRKLFQFRAIQYDPARVDSLVASWNVNIVDPLDLWRSPDGELYLLSGHHRHEAMTRLGIEFAECRIHEVSLQEARKMAAKSNANRLEYTPYEYTRCLVCLVEEQGLTIPTAGQELCLSPSMAGKYYSLRFLIGSDWEMHDQTLDLTSRAFEVGRLCEVLSKQGRPLRSDEIQSLFKTVVDNDLTVPQVKQVVRDLIQMPQKHEQGSLFTIEINRVVQVAKSRQYQDKIAAQTWWLYELLQSGEAANLPADIKADLEQQLCKMHAFCIGADEASVIPSKAGKSGRKLKTELAAR